MITNIVWNWNKERFILSGVFRTQTCQGPQEMLAVEDLSGFMGIAHRMAGKDFTGFLKNSLKIMNRNKFSKNQHGLLSNFCENIQIFRKPSYYWDVNYWGCRIYAWYALSRLLSPVCWMFTSNVGGRPSLVPCKKARLFSMLTAWIFLMNSSCLCVKRNLQCEWMIK